MAVRALLAVAGVLSLVQAAPEDPQSRSMIPQGIITADMFKTARQEAARKLALPPAVQIGSGILRRNLDVDDYEPWAATPTEQRFRRSSEEITFHDLFNMGAAAPKNPYVVYANERSKAEKPQDLKSVNATNDQNRIKDLSSKIDSENAYKISNVTAEVEKDTVSKNKTYGNPGKPFRYRKRTIYPNSPKQTKEKSTEEKNDTKEIIHDETMELSASEIIQDQFPLPLTQTQLFNLFDNTRSKNFVDGYKHSSPILQVQSNSTNLEKNNSTVDGSKPYLVKLVPINTSVGIKAALDNPYQRKQLENNGSSAGRPSIRRAKPTVLIPKSSFKQVDLTWKGHSQAEKYYFNQNRPNTVPIYGNHFKREITTTRAKPIAQSIDLGGKVLNNVNPNVIQVVSPPPPPPPANNKTQTFSFAKPTSYSRPIYFRDPQTLPLSLAPPIPVMVSVHPSTRPKQFSSPPPKHAIHAGIPLKHSNTQRVPGRNPRVPHHGPRSQAPRPGGRAPGSQVSITPQPAHPGLYYLDHGNRLRPARPGVNTIPGKPPSRFRTPLHPPPIVTKSATDAPVSDLKKQVATPHRPSGVPPPNVHSSVPPSLVQRPPGLPTAPRNPPVVQPNREKRRPAVSDSASDEDAGVWSNLIQTLTGFGSTPTTTPPPQVGPVSYVNEIPVGLTPPARPIYSANQETGSPPRYLQDRPQLHGVYGNKPNAFHTVPHTMEVKPGQLFRDEQTGELLRLVHARPGPYVPETNGLQMMHIDNAGKRPGVFPHPALRVRPQPHRGQRPIIIEINTEDESEYSGESSSSDEGDSFSVHVIHPPARNIPRPQTPASKRTAKRHQAPFTMPSSGQQQMVIYPVMSPYAHPPNQMVKAVPRKRETVQNDDDEDADNQGYFAQVVLPQPQYVLQPQYPVLVKTVET